MSEVAASALVVVSHEPFNAEAPLHLLDDVVTPTPHFYVRNHFAVPTIDVSSWRLSVGGHVGQPLDLTFDEITALPSRTFLATLECAGNGRTAFRPAVPGERWQYGAASTAEWTGVPLRDVLALARPHPDVVELRMDGADSGAVAEAGGEVRYQRSLPLTKALDGDTILAYRMNGEALTPDHGYPLRLIVPGWYGMASVKWIERIDAIAEPFFGFYQADRYVLAYPDGDDTIPLGAMAVRSLITSPAAGSHVPPSCEVSGFAWSGSAAVEAVEVTADGGRTWSEASLLGETGPYAWRHWRTRLQLQPGDAEISVRARDRAGNTQPSEGRWNRHGYANNAVQAVQLHVEDA